MGGSQKTSSGGLLVLLLVIINVFVLEKALVKGDQWYQALWVTVPFFIVAAIMFIRRRS